MNREVCKKISALSTLSGVDHDVVVAFLLESGLQTLNLLPVRAINEALREYQGKMNVK